MGEEGGDIDDAFGDKTAAAAALAAVITNAPREECGGDDAFELFEEEEDEDEEDERGIVFVHGLVDPSAMPVSWHAFSSTWT